MNDAHRRLSLVLVAAAAVALLTALTSAGAGSGVTERPRDPTGCGRSTSGGEVTLTTQDGAGRARTYLVAAPANYDPSMAHALVFVFHGAAGTGSQAAAWGLQKVAGAASRGIFVFPNGIAFRRFGVGWDDTSQGYDLPFFDHMLTALEARYCVAPTQVFAAGFSWGGDFVTALACYRGDKLQAIAANSTNDEFKDTANFMTYQNLPCPTHAHPRVRFEHAAGGDTAYPAPDFATTSQLFRYLNSCSDVSTRAPASTSIKSCVSYRGCASTYLECTFEHGLGHTLPPHWAEDTWAFFMAPL